mgnify:CR=1 FL=1
MCELLQFDTETEAVMRQEWEYIRELPEDENGFTNDSCGISWENFCGSYIPRKIRFAEGRNLPEGFVRQVDFLLWDGGRIAGMFCVRPRLNDFLRTVTGGHIGYAIRPEFRGRGLATEGLRLALERLRDMTDDREAYLFCHKDNPASLRVMCKNGGYVHHGGDGNFAVRIPLCSTDKREPVC